MQWPLWWLGGDHSWSGVVLQYSKALQYHCKHRNEMQYRKLGTGQARWPLQWLGGDHFSLEFSHTMEVMSWWACTHNPIFQFKTQNAMRCNARHCNSPIYSSVQRYTIRWGADEPHENTKFRTMHWCVNEVFTTKDQIQWIAPRHKMHNTGQDNGSDIAPSPDAAALQTTSCILSIGPIAPCTCCMHLFCWCRV